MGVDGGAVHSKWTKCSRWFDTRTAHVQGFGLKLQVFGKKGPLNLRFPEFLKRLSIENYPYYNVVIDK